MWSLAGVLVYVFVQFIDSFYILILKFSVSIILFSLHIAVIALNSPFFVHTKLLTSLSMNLTVLHDVVIVILVFFRAVIDSHHCSVDWYFPAIIFQLFPSRLTFLIRIVEMCD